MAGVDEQFVFAAVAAQRRSFAELIDGLDDAQLATPSLCAGWDVKTVAAHVVSTVSDGMPGFLRMAVRCASLSRGIDRLARSRAQAPVSDIVAALRENADRPITSPVFGPRGPLADILVHTGDVRIALGLPFQPDPQCAVSAMDFLTGGWPIGFLPLGPTAGNSVVRQRYTPVVARRRRDQRAGGRPDDGCLRAHRNTGRARRSGNGDSASSPSA